MLTRVAKSLATVTVAVHFPMLTANRFLSGFQGRNVTLTDPTGPFLSRLVFYAVYSLFYPTFISSRMRNLSSDVALLLQWTHNSQYACAERVNERQGRGDKLSQRRFAFLVTLKKRATREVLRKSL